MVEPQVELRQLGPGDAERLAALFARNDVPEVTRWFDPFPLDAATAKSIANHAGADLYWGVWEAGEMIGMAMVRGWDAGHPHRSFGILLDSHARKRGVGTAVTRLILEQLKARGEKSLRARVPPDNHRSATMMQTCGFKRLHREPRHWVYEWRAPD
jgi:RimJ/RimL family protein N-acetyltransferase